ncbi:MULTISPECIES: SDR family NAD(P)-dependent oxidoreductase [unclassified Rhodococcus (in: high G+C Gram-positive bacteria)]|uniref:SDR family NAD(P)-dependent oxidoreductase n=1 Tax=unclassified Rhodococcus (in: high G+C Gram-positive bacteria) TaxID=192944 RepID=UPI001639C8A5|nr:MULTISPECIES: SDR family oxidoreductase [unclassified Rhodococcus (in: high G+C Gram-positive bacteria)]MBC2637568.1 SDR family oxidoreductase [Rhodococcus sp. 3A]MBC2644295.1 SDR family oxidoreductase [Rhodococcus sp. 3A]MBC2890969.1 SDR family oxidoreductase [Rhodococcus sp. 4CII]MBC2897686.1 SDR family oxidoreductase [Rhodococcus sp. 4CII]
MSQAHTFEGKVAIVTGAGSGLGRSHALALARLGATVILNDLGDRPEPTGDGTGARTAAETLSDEGYLAFVDEGDIANEAYARGLISRTVDRYGQVDVLINNAGIAGFGTAQDTTTHDLQKLLNIHLMGSFWTMNEALPHMRRRRYGRIVNTSSAAGVFGAAGAFPYVVAKAAIVGMTKGAAEDNMDVDIRVNALCPLAATPMSQTWMEANPTVDRALLRTESVSPLALYLSHHDCSITGLVLSGGMGKWTNYFTAEAAGVDSSENLDDVFMRLDRLLALEGFHVPRIHTIPDTDS